MEKIGMIGGLGWESTLDYYKLVNSKVEEALGGFHSASLLLYSFDFKPILDLQMQGRWDLVLDAVTEASLSLESAGAEFLIICSNTMHKIADSLAERINIPILNIIDCVAEELKIRGNSRIALLGTRFTMKDGFYADRLRKVHSIESVIPTDAEADHIQKIIYEELAKGIVHHDSKNYIVGIIERMYGQGIEGVVLGCTELPMLVKEHDVALPLFDTMEIYMDAAVKKHLGHR